MKRVLFLVLGLVSAPAVAEDESYVSVLADYLAQPSDKHVPELENGYGLDARYGTVVDARWSYELGAFYGTLEPKSSGSPEGFRSGVGIDALFKFGELWAVTPYLIGGGGLTFSDLASGSLRDPRAGLMFDLGAGAFTRPLAHIGGLPLSARAQAKADYEHYAKGFIDVRVYAGVQLGLSSPSPPPPPAEPVVVVPPEPLPPSEAELQTD